MSDIKEKDLTAAINNVLNRRMEDLEQGNLTKKDVRREVEVDLGLPKKSLDEKKKFIGRCINDFIASHSGDGEEEEEEDEIVQPPKKKRKIEKKKTKKVKREDPPSNEPEKKVVKCRITIAEGKEAPKKGIKDAQRNLMTGREFEDAATPYKISVFGNECESFPRTFSSGNRGWWGGGKIWVPVGKSKHKVWAQLGINLTIIGSKEWEMEDEDDEEEEE